MSNINQKISQLSGLITAFGVELKLSNLSKGEEFLLIQELETALKSLMKRKDEIKSQYLEVASEQPKNIDGAEVFVKIAYPKPTLDANKLEADYIRVLADYNIEYNQNDYLKESTPRKTLVIQSIINK
jgi:hypothetical protein